MSQTITATHYREDVSVSQGECHVLSGYREDFVSIEGRLEARQG